MTPSEISRVQDYLRKKFANSAIRVVAPQRRGGPIEVSIGEEFIGIPYCDDRGW